MGLGAAENGADPPTAATGGARRDRPRARGDGGDAGPVARAVPGGRPGGAEEPARGRPRRGDPAAAGQGRRDHDEQRAAPGSVPSAGGGPPFGAAEAERMSQTHSSSAQQSYGLARVCQAWEVARSTVYLARGRAAGP